MPPAEHLASSRMRAWTPVAIAGLCAVVALSPAPTLTRTPFAALLVLWLPGTALMGLIFPGRPRTAEWRVLAVAVSLALTILCGLILNLLGILHPVGWAAGLALATAAFGLANRTPAAGPTPIAVPRPADAPARYARLRPVDAALFGLAACLAIGAVMQAREGARVQAEYSYTEFWLVPSAPDAAAPATLGIRNREQEPVAYAVDILDGGRLVGRWPPVQLAPGETFTTSVTAGPAQKAAARLFPAEAPPAGNDARLVSAPSSRDSEASPTGRRLEARLYRDGTRDRIYRRAWIAVPAEPPHERGATR